MVATKSKAEFVKAWEEQANELKRLKWTAPQEMWEDIGHQISETKLLIKRVADSCKGLM
jgi:hypothetical protein